MQSAIILIYLFTLLLAKSLSYENISCLKPELIRKANLTRAIKDKNYEMYNEQCMDNCENCCIQDFDYTSAFPFASVYSDSRDVNGCRVACLNVKECGIFKYLPQYNICTLYKYEDFVASTTTIDENSSSSSKKMVCSKPNGEKITINVETARPEDKMIFGRIDCYPQNREPSNPCSFVLDELDTLTTTISPNNTSTKKTSSQSSTTKKTISQNSSTKKTPNQISSTEKTATGKTMTDNISNYITSSSQPTENNNNSDNSQGSTSNTGSNMKKNYAVAGAAAGIATLATFGTIVYKARSIPVENSSFINSNPNGNNSLEQETYFNNVYQD